MADIDFTSQDESKALLERSGGRDVLNVLPDADYSIEPPGASSQRRHGLTITALLARDRGLVPAR